MKGNKIDLSELANYVRVRPSDKDKLAELVIRAKGARRSMRQFALDCGVNPSTLSRIVNQKTAGNNSDELIVAIAEHTDPESGVTLDTLMNAHGKVPKQTNGGAGKSPSMLIDWAVQNIIQRELADRKYTIEVPKEEVAHSTLRCRYRPDLAVLTNAVSENGQPGLWEFELWLSSTDDKMHMKVAVRNLCQKILAILGFYYAGGMKPAKMSFVVTNAELFRLLVSSFDGMAFNDLFSLILVDLEKGKVKEEFVPPLNGRSEIPEVFFPLETEENEEDEDDDLIFNDAPLF